MPTLRKCFNSLCLIALLLLPYVGNALTPFSNKELDELEKEFIQEINLSNLVIRDPLANEYINQLGKKLAKAGRVSSSHFFIVNSPEINAFAGPGGYIGINSALILATSNESELAGVMAHELAHVRLHHLYRSIENDKKMRVPMLAAVLASLALGAVNPALANGALMASLGGFAQNGINFTRANEKEADRIGIAMLARAGIDPRGMSSFFKKMQQHSRYYFTSNVPALLRTHPLDEDRIAEAENRVLHLPQIKPSNELSYRLFKEVIRVSVSKDNKALLEYYQQHCKQNNADVACPYGHALAFIKTNQPNKAKNLLSPLMLTDKNTLNFHLALATSELNQQETEVGLKRLHELHEKKPDNYALMMAYGEGLINAEKADDAAKIFLKGTRQFKQDLPLCEALAHAEASANRRAYAYFTESQCLLLQGRKREAMMKLKIVKKLTKKDPYLSARTEAMMEEIKQAIYK